MHSPSEHSNWLEIDRAAIRRNISRLRELTGVRVMAVVKANGYGHGLVEVARAAALAGAAYCGVARVEEGLELRQAGVELPVLVLGYTPDKRLSEAIGQDLSLTAYVTSQVPVLRAAAQRAGHAARVHVKVDTGMGRLGVPPDQAFELMRLLKGSPQVVTEGVFTHFARADEPSQPATAAQESLFLDLLAELESAGLLPPLVHAANSAAALTRPSTHFGMVRTGIALYGMCPSAEVPLPDGFEPALTWKSALSSVRVLPPGSGVSYGHDYTTRGAERVGVVPVGYGDGYRRGPGNEVLVHGRRVPVVGRVCMDQLMVSLDGAPDAAVGDEVVLIGPQQDDVIRVEDVAQRWQTINYEVTCGLGARVPRIYLG